MLAVRGTGREALCVGATAGRHARLLEHVGDPASLPFTPHGPTSAAQFVAAFRGAAGAVTDADRQYMTQALDLAKRALGKTAPNPAVGCVLVKHGEVRAEGRTSCRRRTSGSSSGSSAGGGGGGERRADDAPPRMGPAPMQA